MIQAETTYRVEVTAHHPQIPALIAAITIVGEKLVAAIDLLTQRVQEAEAKLTVEIAQIVEALRDNPDETQILALADRVEAMGNAIAMIIPDAPPPDPDPQP